MKKITIQVGSCRTCPNMGYSTHIASGVTTIERFCTLTSKSVPDNWNLSSECTLKPYKNIRVITFTGAEIEKQKDIELHNLRFLIDYWISSVPSRKEDFNDGFYSAMTAIRDMSLDTLRKSPISREILSQESWRETK